MCKQIITHTLHGMSVAVCKHLLPELIHLLIIIVIDLLQLIRKLLFSSDDRAEQILIKCICMQGHIQPLDDLLIIIGGRICRLTQNRCLKEGISVITYDHITCYH